MDQKTKEMIDFVRGIIDPVYIVGGCVRDLQLGKAPHDYDFCTPYTPDEMETRICKAGHKPINIGKEYGTIGIHYKGTTIEITSFRKERYKDGSRKPDVEFVGTIEDDLSRRDFRINSMALEGNKLIDPFEGMKDIKNKIISCTGNPTERFKEDPLRMLRACRFAAQLGFSIEEQTYKKIKEHAHLILNVSKERFTMELDKLIMAEHVDKGLEYLYDSGLLVFIIPELSLQFKYDQKNCNHALTLDEHIIKTVKNLPEDINIRYAGLLHDCGKIFVERQKANGDLGFFKHELVGAEIADHIGLYLRWSTDRREVVKKLVLKHANEDSPIRKADIIAHK